MSVKLKFTLNIYENEISPTTFSKDKVNETFHQVIIKLRNQKPLIFTDK
jgi:hypothetical protein